MEATAKNPKRFAAHLARGRMAVHEVSRGALSWNKTELYIMRMISAGVSLAMPLIIFMMFGVPEAGVLGSLLAAGSGYRGSGGVIRGVFLNLLEQDLALLVPRPLWVLYSTRGGTTVTPWSKTFSS